VPFSLKGSRWQAVNNSDAKQWAYNKYRVLLTRARAAAVIDARFAHPR